MNKVNEIKDVEQRKALNAWAAQGWKGSVIAGTGFGKSRVGVLAVAQALKTSENLRALVLVPTNQLQDQFIEEFKKWGYEDLLSSIDVLCYQSAHKLNKEHYCVVVCDEIHLGLSPVHRRFFEQNTYDKLLCLTATVPEEAEYREILINLGPVAYKISLDECVAMGLVADYHVYCIAVELTEEERAEYINHNNQFISAKYRLGEYAFDRAKAILGGKEDGDKGAAAQFMNSIRGRGKVVQTAVSKLGYAKRIADHYKSEKILTFSGSNEFTDLMGKTLSGESYHSKIPKAERREILERFRTGENKILCSTKALDQGFDIKDATIGIIAGLSSKSLPMIQRIGRLIRKDGDKVGKVFILYVKDSQEEVWLDSAVQTIKNIHKGELNDYLT
jgi:superfamily II DNA or RNA helicase|tara:strand:+ start:647 stop:1813 length:1167 start_codon:yes stop_codon:yes gene_type:complete